MLQREWGIGRTDAASAKTKAFCLRNEWNFRADCIKNKKLFWNNAEISYLCSVQWNEGLEKGPSFSLSFRAVSLAPRQSPPIIGRLAIPRTREGNHYLEKAKKKSEKRRKWQKKALSRTGSYSWEWEESAICFLKRKALLSCRRQI